MTVSETAFDRQAHWSQVCTGKDEQAADWFEAVPRAPLDLIQATGIGPDAAIIDVGGGASRLVPALLGPTFDLIESRRHEHHTPGKSVQRFQFSRFRRAA